MKYLCPRDFRRGEMEERMKKLMKGAVLGTLASVLLLSGCSNEQAAPTNWVFRKMRLLQMRRSTAIR